MRVALLQTNPTIGALEDNVAELAEAYRAVAAEAELAVAPELAICGYAPRDVLERERFLDAVRGALEDLARHTESGPPLLVGAPIRTPWESGKPAQNAAVLLEGGRVREARAKSLLPTYDVFDERRWFEPAREREVLEVAGARVGVIICEDLWTDDELLGQRPYEVDPVDELARAGVDLAVCLSASPFHGGKQRLREHLISRAARRFGAPLVYVNQVGAHDELIFDGQSVAVDAEGHVVARLRAFERESRVVDLDRAAPVGESNAPLEEMVWGALVLGVRDYVRRTGFTRALIGLSGGIDSAVTAAIACDALGAANVRGVTMPSVYSSEGSVTDAEALADNLGIPCACVPIQPAVDALRGMLAPELPTYASDVTEQNIQARTRGVTLMALSNDTNALVLTTGNKSELAVGYCTLYGDMCGALSVLSDVPKTLVYRLAEWRNREGEVIPRATIDKAPSAELAPGQVDQDTLPPYEVLDAIIEGYVDEARGIDELVEGLGLERALVSRIVGMIDRNEYKRRQAAPGLRVTTKAFGDGRRMPIACRIAAR